MPVIIHAVISGLILGLTLLAIFESCSALYALGISKRFNKTVKRLDHTLTMIENEIENEFDPAFMLEILCAGLGLTIAVGLLF